MHSWKQENMNSKEFLQNHQKYIFCKTILDHNLQSPDTSLCQSPCLLRIITVKGVNWIGEREYLETQQVSQGFIKQLALLQRPHFHTHYYHQHHHHRHHHPSPLRKQSKMKFTPGRQHEQRVIKQGFTSNHFQGNFIEMFSFLEKNFQEGLQKQLKIKLDDLVGIKTSMRRHLM